MDVHAFHLINLTKMYIDVHELQDVHEMQDVHAFYLTNLTKLG